MTHPKDSMKGKICMVTGATSGIGLVTARELARFGAAVFIVGRNSERCRHAVNAIHLDTGNPSVDFFCADLSSQTEVRGLAKAFLARHDRLHVLVNNAGALFALRSESVDGIEMTLALNHLGPFLLTTLLLDALKAAAPARIVNVASSAHEDVEQCNFDHAATQVASRRWLGRYPETESASLFYSLAMPWAHPAFLQYARSKLANVLFTTELARRLAGTGVTANALHPGVVASNFQRATVPMDGSCTAICVCAASALKQARRRQFISPRRRKSKQFPAAILSTNELPLVPLPKIQLLRPRCGNSVNN